MRQHALYRPTPEPRRTCTWIALTIFAAALFLAASRASSEPRAKIDREPVHLLLITLDTLRADRLGVYGHDAPTSPAIDGLAAESAVFQDVTCSMPTTLPSHVTIFTGLTPAQHGITRNGVTPSRDLTSIFEIAERRGARSAAVVSAGVLAEQFLANMGIDDFYYGDGETPVAHQLPGDKVTDQGIAWLSEYGDEPFALWLHYFDPHEPYTPSPDFAARFSADYEGELGNALTAEWLRSLNAKSGPQLSERDREHILDLYDAEIAFMDAQLGRLFSFLKKKKLWHKTMIVLTADHGQAHGEQGFWGHGWRFFEPIVKVPLLVKLPGQESSRVVSNPVQTLDILPTVSAYYDLETPPQIGGRSLLPTFSASATEPGATEPGARRPSAVESDAPRVISLRTGSLGAPGPLGMALHSGTWKLVVYYKSKGPNHFGRSDGEGGLDGENFYDPASNQVRLLEQVLAAAQEKQPQETPEMTPETVEMLRSLGYVGN